MPSKKHERIKKVLLATSVQLKKRGTLPQFKHIRPLLEMGTLFNMLPWGVHFKEIKLKKENCFRSVVAEAIIPTRPKNTSQIILYFHGGGYTIGSSHTHRALVGKLSKKTGKVAILVEYRKAPEHPFPAALEDALFAYQALLDRGKKAKDIIIAGDSAGGGLAIALMVKLKIEKIPLPAASICISPWVDLAATGKSIETNKDFDPLVDIEKLNLWAKMYSGDEDLKNPLVSPLYANLKGLPPMLIQVSNTEMLYDDAIRLAEKAEDAEVDVTLQIWAGLIHWWHLFQKAIPEACEAIEKIAGYINETFEKKPTKRKKKKVISG